MSAPTDKPSLALKVEEGEAADAKLFARWTAELAAVEGAPAQVVVDVLRLNRPSPQAITAIARFLGPAARSNGWELLLICSAETESLVEQLGLANLFHCYELNPLAKPAGKVSPGGEDPRREILHFFTYLVPSFEAVAEKLLQLKMAYRPPLELVNDVASELGGREGAVVRAESDGCRYRIVFLVGPECKKKITTAFFRGREVPEDAQKDLIAEIANTVVGHLAGQLRLITQPVSVKAAIPELFPNAQEMPAEDLAQMQGKAALRFESDDAGVSVLVGYALKG